MTREQLITLRHAVMRMWDSRDKGAWAESLAIIDAALAEQQEVCRWTFKDDGSGWRTPHVNHSSSCFKFCPECGRRVEVVDAHS